MAPLSTTRLSSKGQVVIPEDIRTRLGLKPGSRFIVLAERGMVVFKTIEAPDVSALKPLMARARSQARKSGMSRGDVSAAIRRVRGRK